MEKTVLVVKKEKNEMFKFKVAKAEKNRYGPTYYQHVVNIHDYKALAALFKDLEQVCGAPVDKAFREKLKNKSPFFAFF